jgi:hypothetical protein
MKSEVSIPANTPAKAILEEHPAPRGATHFRYTDGANPKKTAIDKLKNIDTLAGCSGSLEYGKVRFQGRGRHAKINAFRPMPLPEPKVDEPANTEDKADTPKPKRAGKGRKPKIHGFSACAVAKALGAAGVKYEEADRIMRAHNIEMPKASLSVQLGFGRRPASWTRHGKPAELTDEQIAELREKVAN